MYRRLLHNPNTNLFFYPSSGKPRGVWKLKGKSLSDAAGGIGGGNTKSPTDEKKYLESSHDWFVFRDDYCVLELCDKASGNIG